VKQCIPADWQPTDYALEQLEKQGVSREFALSQVGEFRLYWGERAIRHHAWSAKFLTHCIHEFNRLQLQIARGENTCAMSCNWRPTQSAYDALANFGIPRDFAEKTLLEFRIYWADRGDISNTWNTKFIGHVRHMWQRHCNPVPVTRQPAYQSKPRSITTDLTDRSWARGENHEK